MISPSPHKTALLTWAVIYPLITGLLFALDPLMGHLGLPLRTLLVTLIVVPLMVYVVMPFARRRLQRWLGQAPGSLT